MRKRKKVNRWVEVSLAQLRGQLEVTALEADAQSLLLYCQLFQKKKRGLADPDVDMLARKNSQLG